jgi:hypothetical protein
MRVGCKRNPQADKVPFWSNLEPNFFLEKLAPRPRVKLFQKSSGSLGSDAGQGVTWSKSQLGGNFSRQLFLYILGVKEYLQWPMSKSSTGVVFRKGGSRYPLKKINSAFESARRAELNF